MSAIKPNPPLPLAIELAEEIFPTYSPETMADYRFKYVQRQYEIIDPPKSRAARLISAKLRPLQVGIRRLPFAASGRQAAIASSLTSDRGETREWPVFSV